MVLVSVKPNFELHKKMLEFFHGYVIMPELSGLRVSRAGISKVVSKLKDMVTRLNHPEKARKKICKSIKGCIREAPIRKSKNFFFSKVKEFVISFILSYRIHQGVDKGAW